MLRPLRSTPWSRPNHVDVRPPSTAWGPLSSGRTEHLPLALATSPWKTQVWPEDGVGLPPPCGSQHGAWMQGRPVGHMLVRPL